MMDGEHNWPVALAPLGGASLGTVLWRHRGVLSLTGLIKARYAIHPGKPLEPVVPEPVFTVGQVRGTTFTHARENLPLPRPEIVVIGTAYARRRRRLSVDLEVLHGNERLISKQLNVLGPRRSAGGNPEPFDHLFLEFGQAYGGSGWPDNPIGRGFGEPDDPPRIEHPEDPARTACFAPIPLSFAARRARRGAMPREAFLKSPIHLPDDFDWTYFQAAPVDQQLDAWPPDATIVLRNMHPELHELHILLPPAKATAWWYEGTRAPRPLLPTLSSIHVDVDKRSVALIWRVNIQVHEQHDLGDVVFAGGVTHGEDDVAAPESKTGLRIERTQSIGEDFESTRQGIDARPFESTITTPGDDVLAPPHPFQVGSEAVQAPRDPEAHTEVLDMDALLGKRPDPGTAVIDMERLQAQQAAGQGIRATYELDGALPDPTHANPFAPPPAESRCPASIPSGAVEGWPFTRPDEADTPTSEVAVQHLRELEALRAAERERAEREAQATEEREAQARAAEEVRARATVEQKRFEAEQAEARKRAQERALKEKEERLSNAAQLRSALYEGFDDP